LGRRRSWARPPSSRRSGASLLRSRQ
jgi:hypothetical protein